MKVLNTCRLDPRTTRPASGAGRVLHSEKMTKNVKKPELKTRPAGGAGRVLHSRKLTLTRAARRARPQAGTHDADRICEANPKKMKAPAGTAATDQPQAGTDNATRPQAGTGTNRRPQVGTNNSDHAGRPQVGTTDADNSIQRSTHRCSLPNIHAHLAYTKWQLGVPLRQR